MQCAEFRRLFGANPRRSEPAVLEHRAHCTAGCPQYARDLERLDGMLATAFDVAPPERATPPWQQARVSARTRWYALAASLLVASTVGVSLWLAGQRDKLYTEVVLHADGERKVMIVTDKRVEPAKIESRLARTGTRMVRDLPLSIARVCKIRGIEVPHLIMQTPEGPVHVLVLSREHMLMSHSFAKNGYQAVIVPDQGGSIAVVGSSRAAVSHGAKLAVGAFQW